MVASNIHWNAEIVDILKKCQCFHNVDSIVSRSKHYVCLSGSVDNDFSSFSSTVLVCHLLNILHFDICPYDSWQFDICHFAFLILSLWYQTLWPFDIWHFVICHIDICFDVICFVISHFDIWHINTYLFLWQLSHRYLFFI